MLSKSSFPVVSALLAGSALCCYAASLSGEPGGVVRATLSNGMRIVIVPDHLAPVAATVLNYRVGSNEAPEGFPGMAHAQEHMMFRGSPDLSAGQLANIAAALGGEFNADTQQTVTQYFFTVPSEDIDVPLHVEALRMRGVLDTDKLWDQERGAIEQEVSQDLSNPEYKFYTQLLGTLFKGTPYAHDALGTVASFNQTTGAMLQKFHQQWYTPNNAILIVVGDVQPQKVLASVQKLFGDIPSRQLPARPAVHLQTFAPSIISSNTDLPYGLAVLAFRMPGTDSPDYAASQVLSDVLSSQRSNLYALVPQGKALAAGFDLETLPQAGLGYAMGAYPKGEDGAALREQVRGVLAQYLKHGFPDELVAAAKRQELTAAELQKNSVAGLAMDWSQAVAVEGRNSPDDDLHAIEQVSAADVNRVARKYLDLNDAVTAILTPQESGAPISSSQRGTGQPESFASNGVQNVELPAWAEKALSKLEIPTSTVKPVASTLPNGIKLIVQPETVSHTVSVYGHVENNPDLETPAGQEGVASLLDQLFSYGSTSLNRLAYQKALDDIGAQESAGADFTLDVLNTQLDRGVQLLAENELHPALPKTAFAVVQREAAQAVTGELHSPDYLTGREVDKLLFPKNDPTLRQPTAQTISAATLDDVKDYYRKVYRPDLTTIVVIGDVTPDHAKEVIEKYFGGWMATGAKPPTVLPSVPLNKLSFSTVPDQSRVQDSVTLAETMDLTRNDPDYYALELGNHVLGGGFYATRLYRDLRENNGLVYTVSSTFDVGKSRGIYRVHYGCDPMNVYQAASIVQRDLKQMQMAPVSAGELTQAKAMLLREMPLADSSEQGISNALIYRTREDLPLNEPDIAAHRYLNLTAAQVQAAFNKYLRVGDLVQVTEGPAPKIQ